MTSHRVYSPDEHNRAVRLALESMAQDSGLSLTAAARRVGPQVGVAPRTLRGWVRQVTVEAGVRPGTPLPRSTLVKELKRRQRIEQGWPSTWRLKQMRHWERGGGTPESATAFEAAGWPGSDVLELLQLPAFDASVATPPPGEAAWHAQFGDHLVDVHAGLWPPAERDTVLSLKVRALWGHRERHFVREADGGLIWEHFQFDPGQGWVPDWSVRANETLAELIAENPALRDISAAAIREYHVRRDVMAEGELVRLLAAPVDGGVEDPGRWLPEIAGWWEYLQYDLAPPYDTFPWVERWCSVNDERVGVLDVSTEDQPRMVPLVVSVPAGGGGQVVPVPGLFAEIARWSLSDDPDGAEPEARLYAVADDRMVLAQVVRGEVDVRVMQVPLESVARLERIEELIGQGGATADAYRP